MRKLMRDKIKIYIIDDVFVNDPLGKQIGYNLLEGTVRHDISYQYFTSFTNAFEQLSVETAEFIFFTKPSNTFDPWYMLYLIENDLNEYSLIGHILDYNDEYFELHDQCFIISSKAYQDSGCKPYKHSARDTKLLQVVRSEENFHDNYTPKSINAGSGYKIYKKARSGGLIISSFLENNYKIRPFSDEERKHKFYLYNDLTLKYGSY